MTSGVTRRRTARNVAGWPGGVYTYASFDDFLAAPEVSTGVHSITDGRETIDFHYSMGEAGALAVLFHGAVRAKLIPDLQLPVFSGLKVPLGAATDRLMFSDATMAIHQQLRLGWFCGTRTFDLAARIDQIIARITQLKTYRRVIMLGGSQGGFAALRASRRLPGSVALVWNPQTRIEHFFYPTRVKDFARFCFAAPHYAAIPAPLRVARDMDLTQAYAGEGGARNHVFYMQNRCDPEHTEGHALPFGTALGRPETRQPQLGVEHFAANVVFAFGDWVGGHSLPDRDSVTAIAGLLLDDSVPLDRLFAEADFRAALPESYFSQATPEERAAMATASVAPPPPAAAPAPAPMVAPAAPAAVTAAASAAPQRRPQLSPAEAEFLQAAMREAPGRNWYMEYGSSGTVKMARSAGYLQISTLDSDAQRIKRITTEFGNGAPLRFRPLHADIGPVDSLGAPVDLSMARRWPNYVMKPWYGPPPDSLAMPDFILINGTFRLACCLNAALRAALHQDWPRPLIVLRLGGKQAAEQKQALSAHFEIMAEQGTLLTLQIKPELDADALLQDLSIKMMNPV